MHRRPQRSLCSDTFLLYTTLFRSVLGELGSGEPAHGGDNGGDLAVRQGEQASAGEVDALADREGVALMPRNTIRGFGKHLIDAAFLDPAQHYPQAGPCVFVDTRGALYCIVRERFGDQSRSEEARVGNEGGSTVRSRWCAY